MSGVCRCQLALLESVCMLPHRFQHAEADSTNTRHQGREGNERPRVQTHQQSQPGEGTLQCAVGVLVRSFAAPAGCACKHAAGSVPEKAVSACTSCHVKYTAVSVVHCVRCAVCSQLKATSASVQSARLLRAISATSRDALSPIERRMPRQERHRAQLAFQEHVLFGINGRRVRLLACAWNERRAGRADLPWACWEGCPSSRRRRPRTSGRGVRNTPVEQKQLPEVRTLVTPGLSLPSHATVTTLCRLRPAHQLQQCTLFSHPAGLGCTADPAPASTPGRPPWGVRAVKQLMAQLCVQCAAEAAGGTARHPTPAIPSLPRSPHATLGRACGSKTTTCCRRAQS